MQLISIMINWYKKAQDIPPPPLPMPGVPGMEGATVSPRTGELGEPEESIQEAIKKANKLLKFFIEEDKETAKDALLRVSRFLGSKYSPRLWIVDYTIHPPEIVDYDGIPLSDFEQAEMSGPGDGEEKKSLF